MQLQKAIGNVFVQLNESIQKLSDEQYRQPIETLFNASIGQHVRHVIELFTCLDQGYEKGMVNYEKRKRDYRIETERDTALELLHSIYRGLTKPDKDMMLQVSYDEDSDESVTIRTNYYRELAYNLEHTVHHMALIRVGINEVSLIELPDGYGVASSTIKYRKVCAQ